MATDAQLKAAKKWNDRHGRARVTLNLSKATKARWETFSAEFDSRESALLALMDNHKT